MYSANVVITLRILYIFLAVSAPPPLGGVKWVERKTISSMPFQTFPSLVFTSAISFYLRHLYSDEVALWVVEVFYIATDPSEGEESEIKKNYNNKVGNSQHGSKKHFGINKFRFELIIVTGSERSSWISV
jgi:hypothetical protein